MNTPKDGGPAFPARVPACASDGSRLPDEFTSGLSLRDYFAAKALQGMIGTCATESAVKNLVPACWLIADQMLAAREARK